MKGRILIILLATISAAVTLDSEDYDSLRTFFGPLKRKDLKIFLDATIIGVHKEHKDYVKKIMKARLNTQKIDGPTELASTLNELSKRLGRFTNKSSLSNEQIEEYLATLVDVNRALDDCENSEDVWSKSCGSFKKHFKFDLEKILPQKHSVSENDGIDAKLYIKVTEESDDSDVKLYIKTKEDSDDSDVKLYIKVDSENSQPEKTAQPEEVSEEKDVKLFVKIHSYENTDPLDSKEIAEEVLESLDNIDKLGLANPEKSSEVDDDDLPEKLPEHSVIGSKSDIGDDNLPDFDPFSRVPPNSPLKSEKDINEDYHADKLSQLDDDSHDLFDNELDRLFDEGKEKSFPAKLLPGELNHLYAEKKEKKDPAEVLPGELNRLYGEKKEKNAPSNLLPGELNRLYAEKNQKSVPIKLSPGDLNRLYAEKKEGVSGLDIDLSDLFDEKNSIEESKPEKIDEPGLKRAYSRIKSSIFDDEEDEPSAPQEQDINPVIVGEVSDPLALVGPRRRIKKLILIEQMNCAKCLNDGPLSNFVRYFEVLKR